MKIVVIIPTYNEAENIGKMIDALTIEFPKITNHDMHLLVVEGNSPDGTADVVRAKLHNNPWLHLLVEEKKGGLGAAYINGFRYATKELNADVIVEMDSDFQHDPKDLARLIIEIDNGYDYVIGSRYIQGGSIPKEWAFYRKFLSVGGNIFSKIVLGIYNVDDFTTGFKASRVKGFVDKIDLNSIESKTFAYKLDLLFRMHKLGAKIKQVPIQFGIRDRGVSKIESNAPIETLRVVFMLRYRYSKAFFKFCAVGFVGLAVDAGLFNLLSITAVTPKYAAIISGILAMLTTFLLNNYWSFRERAIKGILLKIRSFLVYALSSMVPIFVRSNLVSYSIEWFGHYFIVYNIAFFIGIGFGLIWNFVVYSKIIWKRKK